MAVTKYSLFVFEIREFMPDQVNLEKNESNKQTTNKTTDNKFIALVTLLNGQSAELPTTVTV